MKSRIVAVDYGEHNFGIAISDPEGKVSVPLAGFKTKSKRQFISHLRELVSAEGVSRVIVGIPATLKGSESKKTEEVMEFLQKLKEKLPVPVEGYDERLTTRAALKKMRQAEMKLKRHKDKLDSLAAAEILQSYLDSRS